ncbi:hypothetical protein RFI_20548 [Reticulomyxa filosa]|uniref:Uncharacterized protein n=1 Tax=Reticulomyxa filosa TaxID=46433 RepID=X6MT07_RETFI|nr:hypothetical protein RFI_20548 [Reticulomyxa filosa]|eukprot:ETO16791.1 hypothetical protein RFI_20548 [Reticulomyxa filosa]
MSNIAVEKLIAFLAKIIKGNSKKQLDILKGSVQLKDFGKELKSVMYSEVKKDGVSKSKVAIVMMNLQETDSETNNNTAKVLQSKFVLKKLHVDIEYQSSSEIKPKENPKFGVEKLEWSPSSRFLTFVNDNMAKYVWI